jgi:hypothetical protein
MDIILASNMHSTLSTVFWKWFPYMKIPENVGKK